MFFVIEYTMAKIIIQLHISIVELLFYDDFIQVQPHQFTTMF
jgi:hypothetical protein